MNTDNIEPGDRVRLDSGETGRVDDVISTTRVVVRLDSDGFLHSLNPAWIAEVIA